MTYPYLLAYKPVLLCLTDDTLHLPHALDIVLEHKVPVTTTCSAGCGDDMPGKMCTCGLYSTWDNNVVGKALEQPTGNKVPSSHPYATLMGIFQLLGKTVVSDDELTLRSWGMYPWGIIRPNCSSSVWERIQTRLDRKYRLIFYGTLSYANLEVSGAALYKTYDEE